MGYESEGRGAAGNRRLCQCGFEDRAGSYHASGRRAFSLKLGASAWHDMGNCHSRRASIS